MASSSQTPPSASLYTTGLGIMTASSPTSTYSSTPRSAAAGGWETPAFMSPEHRKDSAKSTFSTDSSASAASSSRNHSYGSRKVASPTVNVYTHCGRHSNQYLFGGWSKVFHKKN